MRLTSAETEIEGGAKSGCANLRHTLLDQPVRLAVDTTIFLSMVRLITHNILACHAKGCTTNNFPLKFSNVKLALRETDFNPDFLRGFLPRIEWDALVQSSREVNKKTIHQIN